MTRFVSLSELSRRTGYSVDYLRRLVKQERLPALRVGNGHGRYVVDLRVAKKMFPHVREE
jgi:excisionase family DNA binding protein